MNDEKLTADDIACLISGIDKPSECDDCISRQAVLEKQYRIDDSATLSTRDVVNVEDIEEMPSVTPAERTGHWIPVSERLPCENKTVIASTKYGVCPEARYTKEDGWEWAYESGADYWEPLEYVQAWMPLPKPYEPQESEDKE